MKLYNVKPAGRYRLIGTNKVVTMSKGKDADGKTRIVYVSDGNRVFVEAIEIARLWRKLS